MLCATLAARGRLGPRASGAGPSCRLDLFFWDAFFFFPFSVSSVLFPLVGARCHRRRASWRSPPFTPSRLCSVARPHAPNSRRDAVTHADGHGRCGRGKAPPGDPVPRHSRPSLFGSPPGRRRRCCCHRAVVARLGSGCWNAERRRRAGTTLRCGGTWGVSAKAPRAACPEAPAWRASPPAAGVGVAPPGGAAPASSPRRGARLAGAPCAVAAATRLSGWEWCGGRRCHPLVRRGWCALGRGRFPPRVCSRSLPGLPSWPGAEGQRGRPAPPTAHSSTERLTRLPATSTPL